jgi:hypothetical protein
MDFVGNLLRLSSILSQFEAYTHTKSTRCARARGRAIKAVKSQYCGGEYGGEY